MTRRSCATIATWLLAGWWAATTWAQAPPRFPAEELDPARDIIQRLQGLDPELRAQLVRYLQDDVPPAPPAEKSEGDESHPATPGKGTTNQPDPALVSQGKSAFDSHCTTCHDAQRSLSKRKSQSGWLSTVRRMSAKPDAGIPASSFNSIAAYLTSVAGVAEGESQGPVASARSAFDGSSFTPNATISTMWMGADTHNMRSPDFFVDAWMGADWQPSGPLSATVMVCTSCHSDLNGSQGFSLEVVEASATLDLLKLVNRDYDPNCGTTASGGDCACPGWKAKIKAGRFIAPFGAFASMAHPGVYRTLDNPLMFDMGRRYSPGFGPRNVWRYLPVLPQPYSDEGVNLELGMPLVADFAANLQLYAVNGLQGDSSVSFPDSRAYFDNNRTPGAGGRFTVGNNSIRFGTSLMAGQMQDDGASDRLFYNLYGADFTYRKGDAFRLYFEYAARQSDTTLRADPEYFKGIVAEGEVRIIKEPRVGLLFRYDTLDQHRYIIFPDSSIQRYTWGFTFALPGPSTLMVNHEVWRSADFGTFNVLGARWVATF